MAPEAHGDMQAEIEELRRRLGELEARQQALPTAPRSRPRMPARGRLATLMCALGLMTGAGLLYGEGVARTLALFVDPTGRVGIGTDTPRADLDVAGTLNVSGAAALASVNVNQALGVQGAATVGSLEVKGALTTGGKATLAEADIANATLANATVGRATVSGPLAVAGPATVGNVPNAVALDVGGVLRAEVVEVTSPLKHRMYMPDALVHQDIFEARDKAVIAKLGNPRYDDTTYRVTPWGNRRIIKYGGNGEPEGNGAKVTVPPGYDTLWVRVLGDRWADFQVRYVDGAREDLGRWVGGQRPANTVSPDGSVSDGFGAEHQWVAIPVSRAGELSLVPKPETTLDFWLSGVAFSRNHWAHAALSGVGYHWKLNGGDALGWDDGSKTAVLAGGTNPEMKVPVVPSGRDKLLYLVAGNFAENGAMHTGITVNGQPIERFISTYDNPFARHWNSKLNHRYLAARIPAQLIPADARFLNVRIDMSKQGSGIYVREIGTHDFEVPWKRPAQLAAAPR